ncbi:MAG TPA: hypothetical protein VFA83_21085 [Acidimicrobiales bacterium]|nr:hypothetical protein [Acidimicrobiales bacterium]
MSADNRWYSVLDDLDSHLAWQEQALAEGHADLIVAFAMPPGLGPLPPNLEPRMHRLRLRADELVREVTARRDAAASHLASLPRPPRASARPPACYIDTTG